jgi:hypothetical protein
MSRPPAPVPALLRHLSHHINTQTATWQKGQRFFFFLKKREKRTKKSSTQTNSKQAVMERALFYQINNKTAIFAVLVVHLLAAKPTYVLDEDKDYYIILWC